MRNHLIDDENCSSDKNNGKRAHEREVLIIDVDIYILHNEFVFIFIIINCIYAKSGHNCSLEILKNVNKLKLL